MVTISIVSPVLNAEEFLAETLESVLFQKGDFSLQYILVDGGSVDCTLEIARQYQKLCEEYSWLGPTGGIEFVLITDSDNGMYDALAHGLARASGDYIGYLNASDRYLPSALNAVCKVFAENANVHWLTGWNTTALESGILFNARLPYLYKSHYIKGYVYGTTIEHIQQESTFWRSHLTSNLDLVRLSSFRYAGDFYIWCCFAADYELRVAPALLGSFRIHSRQKSQDLRAYDRDAEELASKYRQDISRIGLIAHRLMWSLPNWAKRKLNRQLIDLSDK